MTSDNEGVTLHVTQGSCIVLIRLPTPALRPTPVSKFFERIFWRLCSTFEIGEYSRQPVAKGWSGALKWCFLFPLDYPVFIDRENILAPS